MRESVDQEVDRIIAGLVAEIRPDLRARVAAEHAEWERDNPASRVCLWCRTRKPRPVLVWEVTREGLRRRRWACRACITRNFGARRDGLQRYEVRRG